jgi:hypothetical protein
VADILRVAVLGTMPGGEVWSINPVYRLAVSGSVTYEEAADAALAAAGAAVPTGLLNLMSPQTQVIGIRVEARTLAGVLEAQAEAARPSAAVGSGSSRLVYQSAVVGSLLTAVAGGRGRGRVYWPATGAGIDTSTLRLDASQQTAALAGFGTYLEAIAIAISGSLGVTVSLSVWSRTASSSAPVNRIRVGNVIDTQRRRRDALAETYVTADYIE